MTMIRTTSTSALQETEASSVKSFTSTTSTASTASTASTTLPSQQLSSTSSSSHSESSAHVMATSVNVDHPQTSAAALLTHSTQSSLPIAAIVGATVGGAFVILVAIVLVAWVKHRRKMRIHQAPIYVSPYNTSNDTTPKSGSPHKVAFQKSQEDIQQLDSKDVGVRRYSDTASPEYCAELPAGSVTRL
jgi:hypothetical protein